MYKIATTTMDGLVWNAHYIKPKTDDPGDLNFTELINLDGQFDSEKEAKEFVKKYLLENLNIPKEMILE